MRAFLTAFLITGIIACWATTSASAATIPSSWCSRDDASRCYTVDPGDTRTMTLDVTSNAYMYVKDIGGQRGFSVSAIGCQLVNHYGMPPTISPVTCTKILGDYEHYELRRFHKYRPRSPHIIASYTMFRGEDGITADASAKIGPYVQIQANANSADCHDTDNNPVTHNVEQGYRFKIDAPADFIEQCSHAVKPYLAPGTKPPAVQPSIDKPVKPENTTARCAAVRVGKKTARIVSINTACATARSVMSRYLRTKREPAGWMCLSVRVGKNRVAKCAKETSGKAKKRPTITGTYRA